MIDTITIAVYPDGLLITINGTSYHKSMNDKQKLYMAKELISRVVSEEVNQCLKSDTQQPKNFPTL